MPALYDFLYELISNTSYVHQEKDNIELENTYRNEATLIVSRGKLMVLS